MPMTEVDIANRALALLGTRSTITSLIENSNEARAVSTWIYAVRDEIIRLAPWNCVTTFDTLQLACAAPGTPENPTTGVNQWSKGIPPPPWAYEYLQPSLCLRPRYIVPQFSTGFASGVPITTAVTGGAPSFWQGPPVRFAVGVDQIDPTTGQPPVAPAIGVDTSVIWTSQQDAILCYNRQITDPNIMDSQFVNCWAAALAGRTVFQLTGDKQLANMKLQEANSMIQSARSVDGNEGLTKNDVTPDWIRIRGVDYPTDMGWTPNITFDWGSTLTMY